MTSVLKTQANLLLVLVGVFMQVASIPVFANSIALGSVECMETPVFHARNPPTYLQPPSDPFSTKWLFPTASSSIQFKAQTSGMVDYSWEIRPSGATGLGSFSRLSAGAVSLNIPTSAGDTVLLYMTPDSLQRFYIDYGVHSSNLYEVVHWSTAHWTSMERAFYGCSNLTITATDIPDLSGVTSMNQMFRQAYSFNQDISGWDVSSVTDMSQLFTRATSFNQDISSWDVLNVTSMSGMFDAAGHFNQDLSSWDVSNVTNFSNMFSGASSFNQNLGSWDLSSATSMSNMLDSCGLDCFNYSSTLKGWSENPHTPSSLSLGAAGLEYGLDAVSYRDSLLNNKSWTISGDVPGTMNCLSGGGDIFACPVNVQIVLSGVNCQSRLYFSNLGLNSSDTSRLQLIVSDNNPLNTDTIDCAGTYTYGIFDTATTTHTMICWGTVSAVDHSGPLLHLLYKGRNESDRQLAKTAVLAQDLPNGVMYDSSFGTMGVIPSWKDSMLCMAVLEVYNNPRSWEDSTYRYFTGYPVFRDGCDNDALCACQTTLKATDVLTYYTCPDIEYGRWAQIVRTFTARDCRGNTSVVAQEIDFRRPMLVNAGGSPHETGQAPTYATVAGIVTGDSSNTPHPILLDSTGCRHYTPEELIDLLKKGDYPNLDQYGKVQPKYLFADSMSNTVSDRYTYFGEGLVSGTGNYNAYQWFGNLDNGGGDGGVVGTVVKALSCNYSFDVAQVSDYPACNNGTEVLVVVSAFDWCTGLRHELDYLLLIATDRSKPVLVKPTKPVILSTGGRE